MKRLVVGCLLCCLAWMSQAQSLRYDISGSDGWYPYYHGDPVSPGIMNQLIPLILQRANIQGLPYALPPKKTLLFLQQGKLDFDLVSPDWFEQGKVPEGYLLTEPLIPIRENLIFLPEHNGKWQSLQAIYGQRVGTVSGYLYHDTDKFERVDYVSERELILALQKGDIEVAISGDLPAVYWSKQLGISIQLGPVHSDGHLHMRLRAAREPLLAELNQAISTLKKKGEIDRVLAKFQRARF